MKNSKYVEEKDNLETLLNSTLEEAKSIQIKLQGVISSYNLYKNMEEGYEGYYRSVKKSFKCHKKNQG